MKGIELAHPIAILLAGIAVYLFVKRDNFRGLLFLGMAISVLGIVTHVLVTVIGSLVILFALAMLYRRQRTAGRGA